MSLLTRAELLGTNKRRYIDVEIPTGGSCRFESMTTGEMRSFRSSLTGPDGDPHPVRSQYINELLLARVMVDGANDRMFTDDDAMNGVFDDIDGGVMAKLQQAARRHTGFATDDDFAAIEASVKNSENGQAVASN